MLPRLPKVVIVQAFRPISDDEQRHISNGELLKTFHDVKIRVNINRSVDVVKHQALGHKSGHCVGQTLLFPLAYAVHQCLLLCYSVTILLQETNSCFDYMGPLSNNTPQPMVRSPG
ncbi:uncharacterized protein [Macrobrachium rosenbergii]|uniref:uncharacterized protein n=1 Tax=Macrobrachium rosenbergii TaxID=79674 RepID=UPI0034D44852